jgi:hypothetical protein
LTDELDPVWVSNRVDANSHSRPDDQAEQELGHRHEHPPNRALTAFGFGAAIVALLMLGMVAFVLSFNQL